MFSHTSTSDQLAQLHQFLLEKKLDFQVKFPELAEEFHDQLAEYDTQIQTYIETKTAYIPPIEELLEEVAQEYGEKKLDKVIAVTQEEIDSVFAKIAEATHLNHQLTKDEELYLEQQLSDITGMVVSAEIDDLVLPYTSGTVLAMPHIKLHPTDLLQNHHSMQEAGIQTKRDMLGWVNNNAEFSDENIKKERHFLTLPVLFWETADTIQELATKFQGKKALVISPVSKKLAVAVIQIGHLPRREKYSLGLSPELSRALEVWKPPALGKVFFLLIEDLQNTIKPGIIQYE